MNTFVKIGDITQVQPKDNETIIIAHCCNDINRMGSGVAAALANKWPDVKGAYHAWFEAYTDDYTSKESTEYPALGEVQFVKPSNTKNLVIANIIGQKDVGIKDFAGKQLAPVRYLALAEGFLNIRKFIKGRPKKKFYLCLPLLGCDLAGGSWENVEPYIAYAFNDMDIDITLYVLEDSKIPCGFTFNRLKLV